ncbi:Intermembrane phospholipid transport system binding protein MlaB [Candidatus Erwinia haradaeae]|uniref:Intermembrane phospholipid transport system binding protein MlaB n=1 Tax=Candidatus Erwinia haradaeae TaxID=1922217 RepID=A0A451DJD0_9GAMM|nr:lipid asymmetry maintenance protein MlaB [Candidatus Erwinia haradaeae]VFP86776.1 Intermembrane phospholipid transport system binding protein MlaB [Candidatus Erwinia haradaeae]
MNNQLKWKVEQNNLYLIGVLIHETLLPLWHQRHLVMKSIENIDVGALTRIDTGGLALLIHLQSKSVHHQKRPRISGVTSQLDALISLYNLKKIINHRP